MKAEKFVEEKFGIRDLVPASAVVAGQGAAGKDVAEQDVEVAGQGVPDRQVAVPAYRLWLASVERLGEETLQYRQA
jgi:hypothetical protein